MKVTIKINISKDFKLTLSLIDQQHQEIIIQQEVNSTILFNTNTISFFDENNQNSINFIQKWIENPDDFSTYKIQFQ